MKNLLIFAGAIAIIIVVYLFITLIGYLTHDDTFKDMACNPAVILFTVILSIAALCAYSFDIEDNNW